MNKCKDCCYCVRFASINQRRGIITAIHQSHYCMKKRRHIKLPEYEYGTECKKYKEKATIKEGEKCKWNQD